MTAPPVVTEACVHFHFTLHARPSDAAGIRLSLRPLYFEARDQGHSSGESRRENESCCLNDRSPDGAPLSLRIGKSSIAQSGTASDPIPDCALKRGNSSWRSGAPSGLPAV